MNKKNNAIARTIISVSITESDKKKLKELALKEEKTVSGLIHDMIAEREENRKEKGRDDVSYDEKKVIEVRNDF